MVPRPVQSWIWYGVAVGFILLRFIARTLHFGSLRKLQAEDFSMIFVLIVYTCLIVFINLLTNTISNNIEPDEIPFLTPETISERVYGSKITVLLEIWMMSTQWSCKGSLLLTYNRLTFGLREQVAVRIVTGYVVLTGVISIIFFFGVWCRPFSNYWQVVPQPSLQCTNYVNHLYMNAAFNISSDIFMLMIPLPLLIRSSFRPLKKFVLCVVFGLGIFVVICAILNKVYSFAAAGNTDWIDWYIREASMAVIVANIPGCWPLARRIPKLDKFLSKLDQKSERDLYPSRPPSNHTPSHDCENESSSFDKQSRSKSDLTKSSNSRGSEVQLGKLDKDEVIIKCQEGREEKVFREAVGKTTEKEDSRYMSQSFVTSAV